MRYLPFALLFACGGGEERFRIEGVEALCAAASACAGTYAPAACVDALRAGLEDDACAFDAAAARDCRAALDEGPACEAIEPFDLDALAVPDACRAAYDCGGDRDWTGAITDDLPTPSAG
jgi:hypothetical protein